MSRTVLVTGATGRQGGAVIDALLEASAPFRILALTRNTNSPAAQKLINKSVELVQGDLDDPDAIFIVPIWGIFSVQLGVDPKMTPEREVTQGIGLINAALRNGVQHFVYSSADLGKLPKPTSVPQFQSKYKIEQYLRDSALSWTILEPVVFFENLTPDILGQTFAGALKYYIDPKQKIQFIATADIGWFAAQSLLRPEEYRGKVLRLAGDSMDFAENQRVFKKVTGKNLPLPWGWWFLPWLVFQMILKDLGIMFKHFSDGGFDVDVEEVRRIYPGLMNYEQWLQRSPFAKKDI